MDWRTTWQGSVQKTLRAGALARAVLTLDLRCYGLAFWVLGELGEEVLQLELVILIIDA
jgi:hypothetical protein